MPAKSPLHAQVFGKLARDGYSVEEVLLETYPGFYLGGNLYRPLGRTGPFPGVASPHGHWSYGRLENTAVVSVPGRCINLARQGFWFSLTTWSAITTPRRSPMEIWAPGWEVRGKICGASTLWAFSFGTASGRWTSRRITGCRSRPPLHYRCFRQSHSGLPADRGRRSDQSLRARQYDLLHSPGRRLPGAANLRVDANNVMFGAMMAPRPLIMVPLPAIGPATLPAKSFPPSRTSTGCLEQLRTFRKCRSIPLTTTTSKAAKQFTPS